MIKVDLLTTLARSNFSVPFFIPAAKTEQIGHIHCRKIALDPHRRWSY